jgi:hypothetical protein
LASPLVADFDSDGLLEILLPNCANQECQTITGLWCYKYNNERRKAEWHMVAVDLAVSIGE